MDEKMIQSLASQLREPTGNMGLQVADRMNEGNAFINRYAISKLDLEDGHDLLEIGPGNAYFAKELLQQFPNLRYTGVDYSELMVNEAFKMNRTYIDEGRARVIRGDVNQLPFEQNSFDRILGVNVIYFWDDPLVELAELARVLKTSGLLVLGIRSEETLKQMPVTKFGFHAYSQNQLIDMVARSNFQLEAIETTTETLRNMDGEDWEGTTWALIASKK